MGKGGKRPVCPSPGAVTAPAKPALSFREKKNHSLFMKRSYSCYRDLEKRCAPEGAKKKFKLPFTLERLREIISNRIGTPCPYLPDEMVTARNFSLDHMTPISRGGKAASLANLTVCCKSANLAKGEMTGREFDDLVQTMNNWPREAQQDVLGRLKAGAAVKRLNFLRR